MQRSMWKMFLLLAIVMTFGFVQAGWALECSESVNGTITTVAGEDEKDYVVITTTTDETTIETTIYGIPDKLDLQVGDAVTITYSVQPCGDLVACSVKVDEETTNLRPGKATQSVTVVTDSDDCSCDNCHIDCDCTDDGVCTCELKCDCACDGTGKI